MMASRFWRSLLAVVLAATLCACGGSEPSMGFAPGKGLVRQALMLQLQLGEAQLAAQLDAGDSEASVRRLRVAAIAPQYVAGLPTYRVRGTYALELQLGDRQVQQPENEFDLYLQRQSEGKSWRLLRREAAGADETSWASYRVTQLPG